MRFLPMRRTAKIAAALSAAAMLVGAGVFIGSGGAAAAQNAIFSTGARNLMMVTEDQVGIYSSTSWQEISSRNFTYATNSRFIRVRFSGESQCVGSSGWCSVRVLVGGTEPQPAAGTNFAFDSPGTAGDYESHGFERVTPAPSQGIVTVSVQVTLVAGATSHILDDWTLTVEALA